LLAPGSQKSTYWRQTTQLAPDLAEAPEPRADLGLAWESKLDRKTQEAAPKSWFGVTLASRTGLKVVQERLLDWKKQELALKAGSEPD
jgi:hypothetical protein